MRPLLLTALLPLLLGARPLTEPEAAPGMTCRIRTTLRNGASTLVGGPGADGSGAYRLLVLDGRFAAGKGRLDVVGSGEGAEIGASEYMLLSDSTSVILHEIDRNYRETVLDIGSIVAMVRDIDANRAVTKVKVSVDTLPVDTLEGRPARHYRITLQYTLTNDAGGATTKAVSDYWLADLPVNFNNPFVGLARPRRAVSDEVRPEMEKLEAAVQAMRRGTVVKFIAKGTIGEGTERPTDYIRTMDLTRVKEGDVDDASLKIPEGFTRARPGGRGGE